MSYESAIDNMVGLTTVAVATGMTLKVMDKTIGTSSTRKHKKKNSLYDW